MHYKEDLTEEELEIFDLLKKEKLSEDDEKKIKLTILFDVENSQFTPYSNIRDAKYIANTEPKISNIYNDKDLQILNRL